MDVAGHGIRHLRRQLGRRGDTLTREHDVMWISGVAPDDEQRYFRAGLAVQQPIAFID
jgi:hypothetical protein